MSGTKVTIDLLWPVQAVGLVVATVLKPVAVIQQYAAVASVKHAASTPAGQVAIALAADEAKKAQRNAAQRAKRAAAKESK